MSDVLLSSDQHFCSTKNELLCGTAAFNDNLGQLLIINGLSNGQLCEIFAWETTPAWRILYFSFKELHTLTTLDLRTGQKTVEEQGNKCRGFLKKGRSLFRWKVLGFNREVRTTYFTFSELQALEQAYQQFLKEVYCDGGAKYLQR